MQTPSEKESSREGDGKPSGDVVAELLSVLLPNHAPVELLRVTSTVLVGEDRAASKMQDQRGGARASARACDAGLLAPRGEARTA